MMNPTLWLLVAGLLWQAPAPDTAPPTARVDGAEKIEVSLVLVDVIVRDRKDHPVGGLTRDDFQLWVDGKPADRSEIETFEEVCEAPAGPSGLETASMKQAAVSVPAPQRSLVVYLDFSQLSFQGRMMALASVKTHILERIHDGDQVMILAFKDNLRLIQDFTSDAALLAATIDELKQDRTTIDSTAADAGNRFCGALDAPSLVTGYALEEETGTRKSLAALQRIMPSLAALKGRKALLLFTDQLRIEPGAEYAQLAQRGRSSTMETSLLHLTREANAAGVSIYSVHASGLGNPLALPCQGAKPSAAAASRGLDSALEAEATLALETGGRALQRTNDVGAVLDMAQQDLSCYYLMGYKARGVGNDQRHNVRVTLREGAIPRGATVRYRPYYTDQSFRDRRERLVRSALEAPALFNKIPVSVEAFAIGPAGTGRRVLVKASVPLRSLSLLPAGRSQERGRALLRGELTDAKGAAACSFDLDSPVSVPDGGEPSASLVMETGCVAEPGSYDLTLAVIDAETQETGARREPVHLGGSPPRPFVTDVSLWTRERDALVVTSGGGAIGLKEGLELGAFVPRSQRRMARGQEARMSFLVCPAPEAAAGADGPLSVRRRLLGEGGATVASFDDRTIQEPPDAETGCYQMVDAIPAGSLGAGLYRFDVEVTGRGISAPLTASADVMVD